MIICPHRGENGKCVRRNIRSNPKILFLAFSLASWRHTLTNQDVSASPASETPLSLDPELPPSSNVFSTPGETSPGLFLSFWAFRFPNHKDTKTRRVREANSTELSTCDASVYTFANDFVLDEFLVNDVVYINTLINH